MKLAALAVLCGGCILPMSTGAPLPATTVGQGHFGLAASWEAPVLDLIAEDSSVSGVNYGAAPAAAGTFTVSYGLGDNTDLEASAEGALYYFILPLPTGGSIGLRQHFDAGDKLDVAVAARVGGVASSEDSTDSSGNKTSDGASATYGSFQGVVQVKHGVVRPLLALNLIPARIRREPENEAAYTFRGVATSLTFGIMFVGAHFEAGPYATLTSFTSDRYDGGWFASGGFVMAARPDRSRPKPPPPAPYPYGPAPPAYPAPPPYAPQ
jgi:hypothetical protein